MTSRPLDTFFAEATGRIVILGTNPLIPHLEESASYWQQMLGSHADLHVAIFHESDNENFAQSVTMAVGADRDDSAKHLSYAELNVHRDRILGTAADTGLRREIQDLAPANHRTSVHNRFRVRELHLRFPANVILADNRLWYSVTTDRMPVIEDYIEAEPQSDLYRNLRRYTEVVLEEPQASVYQADPGDELIWVYDRAGVARGIFPRAAFYTTRYARYSVWGLVFNRDGKMLLQQRSLATKDNRGLWDKAVGGHVDLRDASTSVTAKRELVEEMYLPRAEFTKHMRADLADIIDFGEWNPKKRPERFFREPISALSEDDWVMFRAADPRTSLPLTVDRISERLWHETDDNPPRIRRTVFLSDVYFFLAPEGQLETEDDIALLAESESGGAAAQNHKLVGISELANWISNEEEKGQHTSVFTDDLLYLALEHRELLESIAAFARFVG